MFALLFCALPWIQFGQDWDLTTAIALIESGEPIAEAVANLSEDELDVWGQAVAEADNLCVDWPVLLTKPLGRDVARRLAHDGIPDTVPTSAWGLGLDSVPPAVAALSGAGALAPRKVTGHRHSRREIDEAKKYALDFYLYDEDNEDASLLFARVRPHLTRADLQGIHAALVSGREMNRIRALSLLQGAAWSVSQPVLEALVFDPKLPTGERSRLVEPVLLAGGRPMLEKILAEFGPDTPDEFFRRVLILWQEWVEPVDLETVARFARENRSLGRHFALQLWARYETDPARRIEIYDRVLEEPDRFRLPGIKALARGGPDEAIGLRLLDLLDGLDRPRRYIAMAVLPSFLPAEQVADEYLKRLNRGRNLHEKAEWARLLAHLPVPAARTAAARWLAEGGYENSATARQVAAGLEDYPEVDPFLGLLLGEEDVPDDLKFRLGVARAKESQDALDYLRRAVDEQKGVSLTLAVDALVAAGEVGDLLLLEELARDSAFPSAARAAAVRGLAARPEAAERLEAWFDHPPDDYEVAESLVRGSILGGDYDLRAVAHSDVGSGLGFESPEERHGLRVAAWRTAAQAPLESEARMFAQQLLEMLDDVPVETDPSVPMLSPRQLGRDFSMIDACTRALAASATEFPELRAPVPWDLPVPSGALWFSASLLAKRLPQTAYDWCRQIAESPEIHPGSRVRALATALRASRSLSPNDRADAARAMLARVHEMRAYPWDLSHGLAGDRTRGWTVVGDRIVEERLFAEAEMAAVMGPEISLDFLRQLLEGYADPMLLQDASELALELEVEGSTELAVELARRAVDWAPVETGPYLQLGRVLEAAGDPGAEDAFEAVLRMPLSGDREKGLARRALERLREGG